MATAWLEHAAIGLPSAEKETVPEVGTPEPGLYEVIDAVYVTGWLISTDGEDEWTTVVVSAAFTGWLTVGAVDPTKLLSPLYTAPMVWLLPVARSDVVLHEAAPALTGWALHPAMVDPLAEKVTVPVGVPAPGEVTLIVAV